VVGGRWGRRSVLLHLPLTMCLKRVFPTYHRPATAYLMPCLDILYGFFMPSLCRFLYASLVESGARLAIAIFRLVQG